MPGVNTVVIGSSREQKLPSLVLEHTIHKHSSSPVQVLHSYALKMEEPNKPELRSKTGFSFVRFKIPALVGYQGLASYLECDQIVFRDVQELFSIPFKGATVLRPANQASVLLLDCNRLKWDLPTILADLDDAKFTYKQLMEDLCVEASGNVRKAIPETWNSLEKYVPGSTALLHYTQMDIQPWRRWGHPLAHLWMSGLRDAMRASRISTKIVAEEVEKGYVVSQVMSEVKRWKLP